MEVHCIYVLHAVLNNRRGQVMSVDFITERMNPGRSFLYWTNSTDSVSGEPRLSAHHSSCTVGALSIGATTPYIGLHDDVIHVM